MRIVKDTSIYHKTTKRVVVCRLSQELRRIECRMLRARTSHKVIGHMRIISRGLIPSSRPRPDYSSSVCHLFRTIFSVTGAPPSEVALIHQLVSGGTDWPSVHWLIKLWRKLLLWSSPGSHLHPIHIDYDFAVVLAVVLSISHTVVA